MTKAIRVAVESVEFFVRNVRMRLPFRYGKACLVAAPLLHVRLGARAEDGRTAIGVSADMLPPKWFDKDPEKSYRRNISDLVMAARIGADHYLDSGVLPKAPFALWLETYQRIKIDGMSGGLNALTSAFGSSLMERAVLDAAGRLVGMPFAKMLAENRFGIDASAVHPELGGLTPGDVFNDEPAEALSVRHTVGLGDPIFESDIAPGQRLEDGLPQSLESWIKVAGVRFFKIKVSANLDADLERLRRIASLLDAAAVSYHVTLDGNEQFKTAEELAAWWNALCAASELDALRFSVLFIEQPIERAVALSPAGDMGIESMAGMPPILLDESDDDIHSFERGVALGYRGVSSKNCKGVYQSLLNQMLADHLTDSRGKTYFLSGEDLCNQPVAPLQQDLCTLSVLGVTHAERNGHHYCGALDHLSSMELAQCLGVHGDLYEPFGTSGRVRIRDGKIQIGSLQCPGFGVGVATDFAAMTPLSDWSFESLGVAE